MKWLMLPLLLFLFDVRTDIESIYQGYTFSEVEITAERLIPDPDEEDWEDLARLIFCEAAYESYLGKRLVAEVVLNRLDHYKSKYPRYSIRDVIMRKGQFDGIRNRYFRMPIGKMKDYQLKAYIQCRRAAYDVLTGERWTPKSVYYFANERASTDKSWVRSLRKYIYTVEGNHTFYHSKKIKV